ncbi:MAG TPA: TetR/AcrR family transcriptional regulator [Candidatus Solibacter sp.]|nr:TetR/AcrR family transcriptional regulator [Candidatus Solibacter sp.]
MSSSPRGYHHGDLRRALMDAGIEILGEHGVDGLSLREVARRAGVSQAAPYHHFADKGSLLSAIAEQGYLELAEALRAGASHAGGTALQRFHGMGVAYVRFAVEHPGMFRLLFRPEMLATASPAGTFAATASYRVLEEVLVAAIAEGSVTGPRDDVALAAWCAVHGAAILYVDGPLGADERTWEDIANTVTVILGLGFVPRA